MDSTRATEPIVARSCGACLRWNQVKPSGWPLYRSNFGACCFRVLTPDSGKRPWFTAWMIGLLVPGERLKFPAPLVTHHTHGAECETFKPRRNQVDVRFHTPRKGKSQ